MSLLKDLFGIKEVKEADNRIVEAKNFINRMEYRSAMSIVSDRIYLVHEDEYVEQLKYILTHHSGNPYYTDKAEKEIAEIKETYKTYKALLIIGEEDEAKKVSEKLDGLIDALVKASMQNMTPTELEEYIKQQHKEARDYLESVGYKLDK